MTYSAALLGVEAMEVLGLETTKCMRIGVLCSKLHSPCYGPWLQRIDLADEAGQASCEQGMQMLPAGAL